MAGYGPVRAPATPSRLLLIRSLAQGRHHSTPFTSAPSACAVPCPAGANAGCDRRRDTQRTLLLIKPRDGLAATRTGADHDQANPSRKRQTNPPHLQRHRRGQIRLLDAHRSRMAKPRRRRLLNHLRCHPTRRPHRHAPYHQAGKGMRWQSSK